MSEERGKPGVLSWVALSLGMFLLYLLSGIPISWMVFRGLAPGWLLKLYSPLRWLMDFLARM